MYCRKLQSFQMSLKKKIDTKLRDYWDISNNISFCLDCLFLKPPRYCIPASASEDFHTFDVTMKIWGFKPLTFLLSLLNMSAFFYDLIVRPIFFLTWILNNVHKYVSVSFCTDIPIHMCLFTCQFMVFPLCYFIVSV